MDPISLDVELSQELLELGEVAGFLRPQKNDQDGIVVGKLKDEPQTPLVIETDWFTDPLGKDGLGGLPNRLNALFQLLNTVGFLGAPELEGNSDKGQEKEENGTTTLWYPILDPSSSEESTGIDAPPKETGLYLVHESKGGVKKADGSIDEELETSTLAIGFRRAFSSNGISLEPNAVLPLVHFIGTTPSFVTGSGEYPVKFGFKVEAEEKGTLESHGFKIDSFEINVELSESPDINFIFAGLGLPNMPEPHFPGALADELQIGELDLNALKAIPDHGKEWLNFVLDLLTAQIGESAQITAANLKYLLGVSSPDDSIYQPAWGSFFTYVTSGSDNGAVWLKEITADKDNLSHWLHGWFCLFQGKNVNEYPILAQEATKVAMLHLPGIVNLFLTLAEEVDGIRIGIEIESPLFNPTSDIGIQLSVQTDIVKLGLDSEAINANLCFQSIKAALKVRNPQGNDSSLPLFSYRDGTDPNQDISLGTIELSLNLSADEITPKFEARELSRAGGEALNYSLAELFGDSAGGGAELIIRAIERALKQSYENSLPLPESSPSDFIEKYTALQKYGRFLRVIIDFVGVEVPEGDDPFITMIGKLADDLTSWATASASTPEDLPHEALKWFVGRIKDGGLTKALGDVLGSYTSGISVDRNLIRFTPLDNVSLSLGVNQDDLFGVWIEPSLSADWLTLGLSGGIGFDWDDLANPQFSLGTRIFADSTRLKVPGLPALPELVGELKENGKNYSLILYPQGQVLPDGTTASGIEFLPNLEADWLEKLALQLLLPLATDIALNNDSVQGILNTTFPGTDEELEINLSAVLVEAKLLTKQEGADTLHLNSFETLKSLNPEGFLEAAFAVLTKADRFNILKGNWGSFAVVQKDELYGVQIQISDLVISKASNSPEIKLQIGSWLSGKNPDPNWIQAATIDGTTFTDASGLTLYLISATDGSFHPKIELISVGLDVEGTAAKPLFNLKGYQLRGLQSRLFFSWEDGQESPTFGAAIQLEELGIPLGPKAGGGSAGTNPVASNLLASGDGNKGGSAEVSNPTFSAVVAYVDKFHGNVFSDIPSADGKHWIPVSRNFGPLHCRQIGLGFDNEKFLLGVGYDGGVALGPLNIDLDHLTIDIPLKEPQNFSKYKLGLEGLDVSYAGGPISISGGFLKSQKEKDGPIEYSGMALIKAADFTVTGFGSYAVIANEPSLFIFAVLHKDLGGPSCFHVTGLAAGFGYNRQLKLPPIEEVHNFPLVRGALEDDYFGSNPDQSIVGAMEKLRDYIPPSVGDYWFAVGIRFSSFEMIQSFALLSVSFGHDVEIALLGMSTLTVPRDAKEGEAIVYAELAIKAVIRPEEGTIAIEGRLTDESYIFSKDCHLTGGFAFYTWLTGPHAGDFVVTLGGYHPLFKRPDHYPIVPRLAINWQVNSEITINAELYFALTPSCLMAGGKLSAVYQSGSIKAWFIAYADFLLSWKPFYYRVNMGIEIGVEASLRISLGFCSIGISINLHLNVELHIWGPEFAGILEVDLSVISFTIRFGPSKALPDPLTAKEFVDTFLPPPREVIVTQINSGLIRQENREGGNVLRVVNAHALALTIQSLIPISNFAGLIPETESTPSSEALGIRSMGKTSFESLFTVTINGIPNDRDNIRISRIDTGVPDALWGKSEFDGVVQLPTTPEAKTITASAGIRISFAPRNPGGALPAMLIEKFAYETFDKPIPWDSTLKPALPLSAKEYMTIAAVMGEDTQKSRNAVLAVLAQESPFVLNEVNLDRLVEAVGKPDGSYFQADPEICRVGEAFI